MVEIADYRARRYALMRLAVPERVTFIPGSNPNSIIKLFEIADEMKAELVRDIHDGTLTDDGRHLAGDPRAPGPEAEADPDRARALEKQRRGRAAAADYWPDLKLIGCWKGGTVGQFTSQLHDWCAEGLVLRDTGYMSSEAHVSIPITDAAARGC